MERTWQAALVRIPAAPGQSRAITIPDLMKLAATESAKYPAIIYLHGCSGFWSGIQDRIKFLADQGFVVIAPASLARVTYPRSCNVETREGGLFRGTVVLRRNDAGHAIERARELPMIDGNNIILMGFSEGAVVTATFKAQNERQRLRARIVEGWTCHAIWPEYRGILAPPDEPVLSLLGAHDPWYQDQWSKGDCAKFLDPENGSKSIIYNTDSFADQHGLLETPTVQQNVLDFLDMVLTD
ncbi:dienelactone hydrolase family protein [Thalassospira profundimaris]|uniref:Dienelactone hydrolase domain-containing protein n=1 Tax=Thalassospira profundimaris TaxID=502049 RepID=A0A367WM61_9PROT|nr:dienelactone hydrolase family protein [Thalassospira profundimaris]RCK42535.1 hypothetical protein TH30_20780 [Thalassospira profundimaris]